MKVDGETLLAQELSRTLAQFWRVGREKGSYPGIKQSEFMLLINLKHMITPDLNGIKVSELSTRLRITSAAVTQVINSLEDKGYVERLADPKDRRVVLIKLTNTGEEVINQVHKKHLDFLRGLVGYLGEKDTKEFIRLLSLTFNFSKDRKKKMDETNEDIKNN